MVSRVDRETSCSNMKQIPESGNKINSPGICREKKFDSAGNNSDSVENKFRFRGLKFPWALKKKRLKMTIYDAN